MKSSGRIPTGRIKIKLELNLNMFSWRIKSKGLEVQRSDLTMKAKSEIVGDALQIAGDLVEGNSGVLGELHGRSCRCRLTSVAPWKDAVEFGNVGLNCC